MLNIIEDITEAVKIDAADTFVKEPQTATIWIEFSCTFPAPSASLITEVLIMISITKLN